jgi:GT2 family glycosyltransferase
VGWATGACLLVRAPVFRAIGGFDERIFLYFEDKDLCRRFRQAGWAVLVCPGVWLEHELGGSSDGVDGDRLRRIYLESQAHYYRKHHGPIQNTTLRLYRRFFS